MGKTPAVGARRMRVGINYMWGYDKYGLYFGPHQRSNEAPREPEMDFWLVQLDKNLKHWKSNLNVDIVRIFVLCNMQNVGFADANGKWQLPTGKDPAKQHLAHLTLMLQTFQKHEVQVIPSLVDFGLADPDLFDEDRKSVISDPAVTARFNEMFFEPMLRESKKFKNSIFAWEVINEPSWIASLGWPNFAKLFNAEANFSGPFPNFLSISTINTFLNTELDVIKKHGFSSTVGHRFKGDLTDYPTGTISQFHYYPHPLNSDPKPIPDYNDTTSVPSKFNNSFIGEFGAGTQGSQWKGLDGRDGPGAKERVLERLLFLERKGYKLAFVWPDLEFSGKITSTTPDPKLSKAAEDGIIEYWKKR
jgi:hypothetical protein